MGSSEEGRGGWRANLQHSRTRPSTHKKTHYLDDGVLADAREKHVGPALDERLGKALELRLVEAAVVVGVKRAQRVLDRVARRRALPPGQALVDDVVELEDGDLDLERLDAAVLVVVDLVEDLFFLFFCFVWCVLWVARRRQAAAGDTARLSRAGDALW